MQESKVVRYGPQTIKRHANPKWELIASELLVVFMLGAFAYLGYVGKLALLLFPCAIGAAVILLTLIYQLAAGFYYSRKDKIRKSNET